MAVWRLSPNGRLFFRRRPNAWRLFVRRFRILPPPGQMLPSEIKIGAQTVSRHAADGAHTGEVSARMIADVGCDYAIVGHSERRAAGEDDSDVAAQIAAAAAAGLTPVLCAGETAAERDSGCGGDAVLRQLRRWNLSPAMRGVPLLMSRCGR